MGTSQTSQETKAPGPPMAVAQALVQLLMGNRVQQAISVAAKLRVADLMAEGPRPVGPLAEAVGAHPEALSRLLRTLAGYGIFAETDPGVFALTPPASLLRSDVPGSMRPVALWCGEVAYHVFGDLEYSVRTGKPAFDHLFGMEFFDYLASHPDTGALFDAFMARQTAAVAATLPRAYDFSGMGTLVDVGGGRGQLLAAILSAYPAMRGVLFDRPHVIQGAQGLLGEAGVADRCRIVAGDMNESVPEGGDAYIFKSIVHGVDDSQAVRWLENCRRAIDPAGKLLLLEFVIPPGNDPHPGKLMDLLMLVGSHGGRERTEDEFRRLLAAGGFQLARIVPTPSAYCVIEGVPA